MIWPNLAYVPKFFHFFIFHFLGYYERDIEKTQKEHKGVKGGPRRDLFGGGGGSGQNSGLFKNGRRQSSTSEAHQKSESDIEPSYDRANQVTQSGDADDASSVTSLEIPLEEPEPETPKRKIIRVAKKVQLRDFTNEEKGEEENLEEMEKAPFFIGKTKLLYQIWPPK